MPQHHSVASSPYLFCIRMCIVSTCCGKQLVPRDSTVCVSNVSRTCISYGVASGVNVASFECVA